MLYKYYPGLKPGEQDKEFTTSSMRELKIRAGLTDKEARHAERSSVTHLKDGGTIVNYSMAARGM